MFNLQIISTVYFGHLDFFQNFSVVHFADADCHSVVDAADLQSFYVI